MSKKKDKNKEVKKPSVHQELGGFDIQINSFGEINSSVPVEKLNEFLNQKVLDKKLKHRDDLNVIRDEEE